ncbi:hypothetical protein trd_A0297 (plasmid) [Thermomicrobium roseum DSM 5159]|uniref:Uncharacterized protein n=1 Tax=Thermomicrobium roseum (strain ATCC 27502 / DSM 5159 / P-2) TaxID=309801 RepID=B9L3D2_THERP|nr:hypothetical protein trd_A0297 [Thermomicrobium roseum DSM 5159]
MPTGCRAIEAGASSSVRSGPLRLLRGVRHEPLEAASSVHPARSD